MLLADTEGRVERAQHENQKNLSLSLYSCTLLTLSPSLFRSLPFSSFLSPSSCYGVQVEIRVEVRVRIALAAAVSSS